MPPGPCSNWCPWTRAPISPSSHSPPESASSQRLPPASSPHCRWVDSTSARASTPADVAEPPAGRNRLRSVLVASEVALALVALVGAGLFARGFQTTMKIDPGFDPNKVLLSQLYLNTNGYTLRSAKNSAASRRAYAFSPGVTDVAYSDGVPLSFEPSWWEELKIEGYAMRPNENMSIFRNVISPGYLPLMHIPSSKAATLPKLTTKTQVARRHDRERSIRAPLLCRPRSHRHAHHGWGSWFRVVGVAKDAKYHYSANRLPHISTYLSASFTRRHESCFLCPHKGDPENILSTLRASTRPRSQCHSLRCRAAQGVHRRIALSAKDRSESHDRARLHRTSVGGCRTL